MEDTIKIEKVLHQLKSKIEAHNEFKEAYNEQLALDFNVFNFFSVGENKISEILAYFLNPNESHGQSDKFLKEFLSLFFDEEIDCGSIHIECEKVITNNRRIDLFLKAGTKIVAIENKIWAADQANQLSDYAAYLHSISGGNYLLLYLNPYGSSPTLGSIKNELLEELRASNCYRTISYKNEIFLLLDKWITLCKADNVAFFLKQFKLHLSAKFLGTKSLSMTDNMKALIYSNQAEIELLVASYNELLQKAAEKIDTAGWQLQKMEYAAPPGISIQKVAPFTWYGARVYKWSLDNGTDKIWIQIVQEKLDLFASYYLESGTSEEFLKKVEDTALVEQTFLRKRPLEKNISKEQLCENFLSMIRTAASLF